MAASAAPWVSATRDRAGADRSPVEQLHEGLSVTAPVLRQEGRSYSSSRDSTSEVTKVRVTSRPIVEHAMGTASPVPPKWPIEANAVFCGAKLCFSSSDKTWDKWNWWRLKSAWTVRCRAVSPSSAVSCTCIDDLHVYQFTTVASHWLKRSLHCVV